MTGGTGTGTVGGCENDARMSFTSEGSLEAPKVDPEEEAEAVDDGKETVE